MKLLQALFLIFALAMNIFAQAQQQTTKYSVDDVMKKLEAMDNSFKGKVDEIRGEFEQKLNQSVNQIREELSSKIEKIDSKISTISSETEQLSKRVSRVETQSYDLRNRISKVDEKVSSVGTEISDVKRSIGEVNQGVREVSTKIDESSSKFEIISKLGSNKATLVVGFIIVIILSAGVAFGMINLSKLTKSAEKNIIDSFETATGKIDVTANDLKTIIDVLKQQTSEVIAYQKILEERIIS
ncbi:hypothetical protein JGI9_02035, partial [Candidatus Kryptonium thompsonii]